MLETKSGKFRILYNGEKDLEKLLAFLKNLKPDSPKVLIYLPEKSIKLDVLEDILFGNLPLVYSKEEPKEVLIIKGINVLLPETFFAISKNIKETTKYTWISYTRNPQRFQFPPSWKFPQWLRNLKVDLSFQSFIDNKVEYLLCEYAGVINRNQIYYTYEDGHRVQKEGFRLDPNSPICQNLKCFLRYTYGGESGLEKQVEQWLEALDHKNQGLPSTLSKRIASFHNPETDIWDSVFMGSVEDPGFANIGIQNQTFVEKGKRYRRYHEGSNQARLRKIRIDDDPSDSPTCQDISRRSDKLRNKGGRKSKTDYSGDLTFPEGISFFEAEDWTPTNEHIPVIKKQLINRYGEDWAKDNLIEVKKEAGYYHITQKNPYGKQSKLVIEFCVSYKWNDYYDTDLGKTVEGFSKSVENKNDWVYGSGQIILAWKTPEGEKKKLTFKSDIRIDAPCLRKDLYREIDPENIFELNRTRILSKKGEWLLPYSFTIKGKKINVKPKPSSYSFSEWTKLKRNLSTLEIIKKLLHEERWEKLAFSELYECMEDEFDIEEHTEEEIQYEAYQRIESKLLELEQFFLTFPNIKKEVILKDINDVYYDLEDYISGNKISCKETSYERFLQDIPVPKLTFESPLEREIKKNEWNYIKTLDPNKHKDIIEKRKAFIFNTQKKGDENVSNKKKKVNYAKLAYLTMLGEVNPDIKEKLQTLNVNKCNSSYRGYGRKGIHNL